MNVNQKVISMCRETNMSLICHLGEGGPNEAIMQETTSANQLLKIFNKW